MSGYQYNPPKPRPDPATIIALLRRENTRLQHELHYWKTQAQQGPNTKDTENAEPTR